LKDEYADKIPAFWYYRLAQAYIYSEFYSKSIEYLEKAQDLSLKQNDSLTWALAGLELGNNFYNLGRLETAKVILNSALQYKNKMIVSEIVSMYNTLGLIEKRKNQIPEAIQNFNKAMGIAQNYELNSWIGVIYGNIGSCYYLNQDYDKALIYYQKDVDLSKKYGQYESAVKAMIAICEVYIKTNQTKKFQPYLDTLERDVKWIKKQHDLDFPNFFKIKSEYFKSNKQYDSAFFYLEIFLELFQNKQSDINSKQINELQVLLQSAENEKKIIQLQDEKLKAEADKKLRNVTNSAILIGVLLLFVVIFFIVKENQIMKKKNQKLKAQKEELSIKSKRLEELNEIKTKLFSIISHDLRNPFLSLNGLLSLFDAKALSPSETQTLMLQIRTVSQNLYASLNNLLEWSRSQMEGFVARIEEVNLNELVEAQINFLSQQSSFKDIVIKNQLNSDIYKIKADSEQINFLIRNILGNAIKFTHVGGSVFIRAKKDNNFLELSIEDTGVGMTQEQIDSLFDRGIKTSSRGTLKEKGTGLGLMVSKEFVEANGGTISVRSTLNVGTTFYLRFPIS
jgi:signal transduction histidine kinase